MDISSKIVFGSLLLSRPLVKGTTQNVHMLSQPLVMDTKALTPLLFSLVGFILEYVSSLDNNTFIAVLPSSKSLIRLGRSL